MVTLLIFAAVILGWAACFFDRPTLAGIAMGCAIMVAFL